MNPQILKDLVSVHMPYGKYKGKLICDIPEYYLAWYENNGFPEGKIGVLLSTMYVIKLNGLEYLLKPLKK